MKPQLLAAYPNPFNPTTRIEYTLEQTGAVQLNVYDINGRIVKVLEEGFKKAGRYQYYLNASGLNTGVYIVRLHTTKNVYSQKILLMK
jgi:hypothetical protein